MFDTPVDGWYAWLGVAVASVAVFATAAALPTAPPPDAASAADTVDRTAATAYGASAEHPLAAATVVRITAREIGLRNDAGTTHAVFAYGPVTPVREGTPLASVLAGAPPDRVFGSPAAFARAARNARERSSRWRDADGRLLVRHVRTGGVDVVLVGA